MELIVGFNLLSKHLIQLPCEQHVDIGDTCSTGPQQ